MEAEVLHKKTSTEETRSKLLFPKLRFKAFNEEWSQRKLSSFITFISGYAFNSSEMKSEKNKYQLIKMSNVYKSELQLDRSPSYWGEIDNKLEKYLLKKDDILLTLTGTVGKKDYGYSVVIPDDNKFLINQRLVCLRYIPNISEGNFINNLIKTSRFFYLFFGESKGGTGNQTNVGIEDLRNIKLNIPTLPEQQKIASFLSAVDEKIQQLTRKKELLEQYKKGVMQQLFSGKLRFKDENGKAFPKWEEKKLGDVSKIYDGTHQTPTYVIEGIPFYSVEHVTANQFTDTKYISKEVFDKENEKVRLEKGDILMTKIGDIGTARLIDWEVEASFYVSLALIKKSKMISSKYLNQYIATRNFQLELWKRIIHVAFPKKINLGEIGNCLVQIPSTEEQNKIADLLSSIDNKLEYIRKQITQTQTFKKGLLQQMFM